MAGMSGEEKFGKSLIFQTKTIQKYLQLITLGPIYSLAKLFCQNLDPSTFANNITTRFSHDMVLEIMK